MINTSLLGSTFTKDIKPDWFKINGIVLGNSPQFGYTSTHSNDIGRLLDECKKDPRVVVVLYNWSNGNAYIKTGFNLNAESDYKKDPLYTAFIIESRVKAEFLKREPVSITAEWMNNKYYSLTSRVYYKDCVYECIQAHTSNIGWLPDLTKDILWKAMCNGTPIPVVTVPAPVVVAPTPAPVVVVAPTPAPVVAPTPVVAPAPGVYKFRPYIDLGLWPTPKITTISQQTGIKFFTLAFVTSSNSGEPTIVGAYSLDGERSFYLDEIKSFRQSGGEICMSFGGASGLELAQSNSDVDSLVVKIQSVIDTYSLKYVDFDIEGSAIGDPASVDRRNKALVIIKQRNPGLQMSYTLPVMPDGLNNYGTDLLKNARDNKFTPDSIGLMVMDYGQRNQQMGRAAITAGQAVYSTLQSLGMTNTSVYLIPMIGQNDTQDEVFSLANAKELLEFAKITPWVSALSYWSIARDTKNETVNPQASYAHSGIIQESYDFAKIFNTLNFNL